MKPATKEIQTKVRHLLRHQFSGGTKWLDLFHCLLDEFRAQVCKETLDDFIKQVESVLKDLPDVDVLEYPCPTQTPGVASMHSFVYFNDQVLLL